MNEIMKMVMNDPVLSKHYQGPNQTKDQYRIQMQKEQEDDLTREEAEAMIGMLGLPPEQSFQDEEE